jgi:hypothetical protein
MRNRSAISAVLLCLPLLFWRVKLSLLPPPLQDFVTYWASGRLLLTGHDPYSSNAVLLIERSLGWTDPSPLLLLNPPWALFFPAVVGSFSFPAAHYGWYAACILLEIVSVLALWRYFGGEWKHSWIGLLILAAFIPAIVAEHMGQVTPLMLAAFTAFLFALRNERFGLAGICLFGISPKPHLLYLVILAVLLWSVRKKKWKLIATAALSIATAFGITLAFNPNVKNYFDTTHTAIATGCGVGAILRAAFGVQHQSLQFVPVIGGLVWFTWYWKQHRQTWEWSERVPSLILVSICTSPYFWAHDFVLALPSLIAFAVKTKKLDADWLVPSGAFLLIQALIMRVGSVAPIWMPTLSLGWLYYVIASAPVPHPPRLG